MSESGKNCRTDMLAIVAIARNWRTIGLCLVLLCAQQYSVYAASFSATGNMASDRKSHVAVSLADGRVLITGGTPGVSSVPVSSAEIYDPVAGTFTATGSMTTARVNHTATRLPDGKVLIVGGFDGTSYVATAEIFDPAAGTNGAFTPTGSMNTPQNTPRANHSATLLNDGTVLVAGGQSGSSSSTILATAQIYTPATGTFSATSGPLSVGRRWHTATLLNDGRVLFAGGRTTAGPTATRDAEVYTPAAGTFAPVAAKMASPRHSHVAVSLNDGRVLLSGGFEDSTTILASAEIFDPAGAGSFSAPVAMTGGRANHTATRLLNGKVLIAGGYSAFNVISTSGELFDPTAGGSFADAGTMTSARTFHAAALLNDGSVLIAGGTEASSALISAELYDPGVIKVSPAVYAFPDALVLGSPTSQNFTLTNSGSVDLTLNTIGISGTDGSMFTLATDSCGPLPLTLAANGGTCSISVEFNPTSGGDKTAFLNIASSDPERPILSAALSGKGIAVIAISPTLTVHFGGTGAGSTTSSQAGLTCLSNQGGACKAQVEPGTEITIFASADNNSLFVGWSGGCNGSGACTITVNNDGDVTATFNYVKPAKINSSYFSTLQEAYAAALAGDVIEARAFAFTGPLNFDRSLDVILKGGYDLTYGSNPDFSVVDGGFIVSNGSATVENLMVR